MGDRWRAASFGAIDVGSKRSTTAEPDPSPASPDELFASSTARCASRRILAPGPNTFHHQPKPATTTAISRISVTTIGPRPFAAIADL
ncbi:MAG TPA: hypothetical protein PK954_14810, partial [Anaerolineales bacterium]|nr:hypothetical protein [Anaerolineales bacterium]